jgi:asparagine synthase (glutamine-hydrolysing)
MCGIAGEIRFDHRPVSVQTVVRMLDVMRTRGPDDQGLLAYGRRALGHRRLKIIDLSDRACQPMEDPELNLAIVFNGCIYNHQALRKVLTRLGYRFFSHSDTEVIVKAYHAWGTDCVRRFNGMFAFAIVERNSGRVFLARDRLGIKPLYYVKPPVRLRFASSLPTLLGGGYSDTAVDQEALHYSMTFHAVVPPPWDNNLGHPQAAARFPLHI